MANPGVAISSKAARASRGDPTDTGVWFVIGLAERGPVGVPTVIRSLDEFTNIFGNRVAYSVLYDCADCFFAEGGAEMYVSRVVGPAPVLATVTVNDRAGAPIPTLRFNAVSYGDWGNGLTVAIANGAAANTFTITVKLNGQIVETFNDLASPDAAVAATATSAYIRAVKLADATAAPNNNPAVIGDTALAGGTDDHASSTDANWQAALGFFTRDFGPGQVSAPGRQTAAMHALLIAHAVALDFLRTPYLDSADAASKATLLALAAADSSVVGAECAGLCGSWKVIPGLVPGTSRAVPGSAFEAAKTNSTDQLEGTAGAAPAGEVSTANYVIDVDVPAGGFTEQDYTDLNNAGVIMSRNFRNRGIQIYGFRSLSSNVEWVQLTSQRLRMSLTAKLEAAAQAFPFKRIDGKGHTISRFNGALTGVCKQEWDADALFSDPDDPDNPATAYRVDTGDTVNTIASIADRKLRANVYARFAPTAEQVVISLVKEPITAPV